MHSLAVLPFLAWSDPIYVKRSSASERSKSLDFAATSRSSTDIAFQPNR